MIGDRADLALRLRETLPAQWFGDTTPVLDAVLAGLAESLAYTHRLIDYADHQTRILTATHGWLDVVAADFFGATLPRRPGQSDTSYRALIIANLFRERATRAGLTRVLRDLTGREPTVFEPWRPADTGAYGIAAGYGAAGGYGSLALRHQVFVRALRPAGSGIPRVAGYGTPAGGYGAGRMQYASLGMLTDAVTEADIYEAVDRTMPAGSVAWVSIQ